MANEIYKYYTTIQDAIKKVDTFIDYVETESAKVDEFSTFNYTQTLTELYNSRKILMHYLNANKYFRLNKEDFIKDLGYSYGINVEKQHTVKAFETPLSIAAKYNVTLESILQKNNITISAITAGKVLRIDISNSEQKQRYNDIMTYGDQSNDLVYGNDLPCELAAINGDLSVLDNIETLKQGIQNLLNTPIGNYPLQKDFGIDPLVGMEYPEELKQSLIMVKASNQIENDKRIATIDDFKFDKNIASIKARTINNKNIGNN